MEIVLFWIMSFIITGIDDYFILLSFYLLYKKLFFKVMIWTSIGLAFVILTSFIASKLFNYLLSVNFTILITCFILSFLSIKLIKEYFKKENELEECNILEEKNIIKISRITYIINGLDDFLIYYSFFLHYQNNKDSFLFTIWIFSWLILYGIINSILWKQIYALWNEKIKLIKLIVWILLILLITYLLWTYFF